MEPAGLRPLGVGEILDVAIKIYRARFKTLITAVAIVVGPVYALVAIISLSVSSSDSTFDPTQPGTTSGFQADQFWAFLAGAIVIALVLVSASQVATGACCKAVGGAYLDENPDWRSSLRFARERIGSLLMLVVLVVVLVVPAVFLCVLPGLYLYVGWAVAAPVLLLEGTTAWAAMKRSRQLVKGRFWPTAAVLVLMTILTGIVQAIFLSILTALVSSSGNDVATAVANFIGQTLSSALVTPLSAAVLTVLYFDLRVRKEGFDLELLARQLGADPGAPGIDGPPPAPPRPWPEEEPPASTGWAPPGD